MSFRRRSNDDADSVERNGFPSRCSLTRRGRVDIYTARSGGSDVVNVTDTPDFEDLADWGTHGRRCTGPWLRATS